MKVPNAFASLLCLSLILATGQGAAAQALTSNTVVHGVFTATNQVHSYTFSADLDNGAFLSCIETTSGSPLSPRITVLDPSLTLVDRRFGDERAFVSLQAQSVGTYTVQIDSVGTGPGEYDLYFAKVPGPSELPEFPAATVRRETITRGDIDTYAFTANTGDSVFVRVVSFPGFMALQPYMQISNPDGSSLATVLGTIANYEFRATRSGTYSVMLTDVGGNSGAPPLGRGDYDIHFARIPGASEGGLLSNDGKAVLDTLTLGDIDTFTYAANQGDSILLRAVMVNGTTALPVLRVYRPNGVLLQGVVPPVMTASETGTYTVLVNHDPNNPTGPYSLRYARVPGANERGALSSGQSASGTFEAGDLESYTLPVSTPGNLSLSVSVAPWDIPPTTRVFDPTGALVAERGSIHGQTGYVLEPTLAKSGTYTIVLSGDSHSYSVLPTFVPTQQPPAGVPMPLWSSTIMALVLLALGLAVAFRARAGAGAPRRSA